MRKRKQVYECVFECERNEYQFHFRAWNEAEAEARLRETLSGHGVAHAGTLLSRDFKGHVARRATYAPAAAEEASP